MLMRYAEKVENVTLSGETEAAGFTDSTQIADYAADAVLAMKQAGIISGKSDGSFAPNAFATRGEAAKMIALFLRGIMSA